MTDRRDPDAFERELTTDLDNRTPDRPRGMPLHKRILLGLAIGAGAGVIVNAVLGADDSRVEWLVAQVTEPIGALFLRLLLMIVVPLVFSSLVVGVAGLGTSAAWDESASRRSPTRSSSPRSRS